MSGTLHFIHVGKTGGSALAGALVRAGYANWSTSDPSRPLKDTPYGRIQLGGHHTRLWRIPQEDHIFFCVRDPIERFVSAFHSRRNKGMPRYFFEWTERERMIFELYPTPQALADALAAPEQVDRELALWALGNIRHLRPLHRYVGGRRKLHRRRKRIVYIARQESLDEDWPKLRAVLGLPERVQLKSDPLRAHRRERRDEEPFSPEGERALRAALELDYKIVDYCEQMRRWRGWGPDRPVLERLRGAPVLVPPPPKRALRLLRPPGS